MERAISKLLEGRTCILIAHRLATVQRADLIVLLDKGSVLERGKRTELASDPRSHFHRMLEVGLEEVLA
jgi:ATP-binding cassette subfamily B protein